MFVLNFIETDDFLIKIKLFPLCSRCEINLLVLKRNKLNFDENLHYDTLMMHFNLNEKHFN